MYRHVCVSRICLRCVYVIATALTQRERERERKNINNSIGCRFIYRNLAIFITCSHQTCQIYILSTFDFRKSGVYACVKSFYSTKTSRITTTKTASAAAPAEKITTMTTITIIIIINVRLPKAQPRKRKKASDCWIVIEYTINEG